MLQYTGGGPLTTSVALAVVVPPALLQLKLYMYVLAVLITPVDWDPPVRPLLPVHPPDAVHDVAPFPTDHVIVADDPVVIEAGDTDTDTVGFAITVREADADEAPALLLHASVYVYNPAVVTIPLFCDPDALFAPPQLPLAVHDVGLLVADQLIVVLPPVPMVVGLRLIATTGLLTTTPLLTLTDVVAEPDPPALLHVNV